MRGIAIMAVALAGLGGCADMAMEGDTFAREAAKAVVNDVVSQRLPGVDARPVTDCVIDNASGQEVVQIAQASLMGPTPATTNLVLDIAQRPQTARCIADGSLGLGSILGAFG